MVLIEDIISFLDKKRQILLYSATFPISVQKFMVSCVGENLVVVKLLEVKQFEIIVKGMSQCSLKYSCYSNTEKLCVAFEEKKSNFFEVLIYLQSSWIVFFF